MPEKGSVSSPPVSTWQQSPTRAGWSPRYSTIGRLQSRSLPPVLSQPSSIELSVFVDGVEADLYPDRREAQDSISLDNLIRPTIARPGVQVDTPSILFNNRVLLDRWCSEVIEFLSPAILPLGAG